MSKTIWKDIPEYEGLYQISNKGEVRSLRRVITVQRPNQKSFTKLIERKILDQYITGLYLSVSLSVKSVKKCIRIHRQLAESFIPNPENKPQVNHIDGNKLNNDLSNLEWCTPKENIQHAWRTGLCNTSTYIYIEEELADKIRESYKDCKNIMHLTKEYNLTWGIIDDIIKGTRKSKKTTLKSKNKKYEH